MEFKERGWNGKNSNFAVGVIKKSVGPESKTNPALIKVQGKFTESLSLIDLR
jgi:hypothetical protein